MTIDYDARVPVGVDVSLKKQLIRMALACISPGNDCFASIAQNFSIDAHSVYFDFEVSI